MGASNGPEIILKPSRLTVLAIIAMILGFIAVFAACNAVKFKYDGNLDPDSLTDAEEDTSVDTFEEVVPDSEEDGPECYEDTDCDDADECTHDLCVEGSCEYEPVMTPECHPLCTEDSDCDDGDECTIDTCEDPGYCFNEEDPSCTAECTEDFHCEDSDICTIDTCVEGVCEHEFDSDITIEVIEDSTSPSIRRGVNQQLLKLRITSDITMDIDELTFHIGADCSADGLIESDPTTGIYEDIGGHCGSDSYPHEGIWNDAEGVDLLWDIKVIDTATGATLMGPKFAPVFYSGTVVDDAATIHFIDDIPLVAGTPLEIEFLVETRSTSTLRANLETISIIYIVDVPVCRDYPPVLEGLPRPVVE